MLECIHFSPVNKNTCVGMATIYIPNWHLEISGISLHEKNDKRWISLPARKYEKDGETKYSPYIRFKDKDIHNRFCEAVKKAIDQKMNESNDDSYNFEDPNIEF